MDYIFLKENLKKILKEKKITYEKLAEKMTENGFSVTAIAIHKWMAKKDPIRPTINNIIAISKTINIPLNNLIQQEIFKPDIISNVKSVKIIGEASCGLPISNEYQDKNSEIYISENFYKPELYAVRATGDSMMPEVNDGDILICDPTENFINGDLVHYILFSDSAIKIFLKDKSNNIQFKPLNLTKNFITITIMANDTDMLENLTISKVVSIVRNLNNSRKIRLKMIGG